VDFQYRRTDFRTTFRRTAVRIAYLTTDEVNGALAVQMAAECGMALDARWPRDWPPQAPLEAVVYDLDYLPPEQRQEILWQLLAEAVQIPTVVHSYQLEEHQVETLRRHGVVVERRLDVPLFQALRGTSLPASAVCPVCASFVLDEVIRIEHGAAERGVQVPGTLKPTPVSLTEIPERSLDHVLRTTRTVAKR
jgi:hypothetical protein